jgi:hypothetical protein
MAQMRVFEVAKAWCERNTKWQRICDIEDSDGLLLSFDELPKRDRRAWVDRHGDNAEYAWRETSSYRPCRHRFGFVGENGCFYDSVTHLPPMMRDLLRWRKSQKIEFGQGLI